MRKRTTVAAALVSAATALALTACSGSSDDSGEGGSPVTVTEETAEPKAATVLDNPFKKPDLVLTDTHGEKYDLRAETKGRPVLLYFGYTNCPDVCPLTMSNIAVAKKSLPKEQRDKVEVVFVTTDPGRDKPKALGSWLKAQDPEFTGLTGDFATIQAGARQIGISIEPSYKDKKGKVVSMHGTQVIAFSPKNDAGYVVYGEDATVDDWTKDLPKLIKGQNP